MRSVALRVAFLVALALVAAGAAYAFLGRSSASARLLPAVVVDSPSAERWVEVLRSAGVAARAGTLEDGLQRDALVVPGDAVVDTARVASFVRKGGRAVVASPALAAALGIHTRGPVTLHGFAPTVRWGAAHPVRLPVFARRGNVLAVGVDPFADGLQGWELLPTLGTEVAKLLGRNGPTRDAAEFYFDPGTLKLSPEQAAARFADARAVFVAGWNYGYIDYPYKQLIDALHARGVRAYAWLEPPMVNIPLFRDHPECREITRSGRDAVVDWRSLVALEVPKCFDLAWSRVWQPLLTSYDWDGVDIAELYFEPGNVDPNRETPYHPYALHEFGKDPLEDRAAFFAWRTQEVTRLNGELVQRVRSLPKPLDVELTVIDNDLDPAQGEAVGSDVHALAHVASAAGASLQVEDPYTTWTLGPTRYLTLGPKVTPLMPPGAAFFDLNIVRRPGGAPTVQMTGDELSLSIENAAQASGRVAIYSTGTLPRSDLDGIPYAAAGAAQTGDGELTAPWTVVVTTPRPGWNRLVLDGRDWPAANGRAVVPGGTHRLAWRKGDDGRPALERIDGELKSQSATARSLHVAYTTAATAWAVVDRRPRSLTVDGKTATLDARANPAGGWTVRLPAGDRDVTLGF